jgi:hypothetical protein
MDTFRGTRSNSDHAMEANEGSIMQERSSIGDLGVRNLDELNAGRPATPSPGSIAGFGRTSAD